MDKFEFDEKVLGQLKELEKKFEAMGQDLSSYLDGLLHADYLTYWNYIQLDTLLSLQNPKTKMKDEMVFIIYHQITELYFKLIMWEIEQMEEAENSESYSFRLNRIIQYFTHLTHSFLIMIDGMEKQQFLKFRMSLLPASGFQSAQYRFIEICSTDIWNLVDDESRSLFSTDSTIESVYKKMYWKKGSTELATGKKTLTLEQFEAKYYNEFIDLANKFRTKNIWQVYQNKHSNSANNSEIVEQLRKYDELANVHWPLAHYKSAVKYLQMDPEDIKATGGTNWQKYLPPKYQKVIFYPDLWTEKEISEWGKSWVMKEIYKN